MTKLSPFRVSFDAPLGSRERAHARLAATVTAGAAVILGVLGIGTLLNASSNTIASWSNASPEPAIRIVAGEGEDPAGRPCGEQTWPYIEQRCLKRADPKSSERSTPKHGLGSQRVALPSAPAPADTAAESDSGTTGSAPSADDTEADRSVTASPARPAGTALPTARLAIEGDAARQRHESRPLSRGEQRRLQREERTRRQHALREEARRAREERLRARAEARDSKRANSANRDDQRIVRRWTEYTYRSPDGRSRRVVVIRRGSLEDSFFRNIR